MKLKVLFLLTFSFLFITLVPTIGSGGEQEYENPHDVYTNNTNACSLCHSTHQARAEKLLVAETVRDTCFLCHDGRGSNYDVKNGNTFLKTSETSGVIVESLAGGFNSEKFTSTHAIEEYNSPAGGAGETVFLTCTSCHNPHGSDNYRLIPWVVNGIGESEEERIIVNGSITQRFFKNSTGDIVTREIASYESGISEMCSACHNDYIYRHDEEGTFNKTEHRHPIGVGLDSGDQFLFTTLPTEGSPSGAYPLPETTATTGGLLSSGTYYYIVTASNVKLTEIDGELVETLQESHQGFIKKVDVPSNGQVNLKWKDITNALHYSVYRAGPSATQPSNLSSYRLVATSSTESQHERFIYDDGYLTFVDNGTTLESETKRPPDPNGQAKVSCMTCHFAHGSRAIDVYSGEGKLRRMNNNGVCQDCHKK